MSNTTIETIDKSSAWMELEKLRDQLYGIYTNLNLMQVGIENNGYPEFSEALTPIIDSLISAHKQADGIMEALKS